MRRRAKHRRRDGRRRDRLHRCDRNVFIESALFDPARIAASGRKLGILSDARYRFERGVDPEFVISGMEMATRLILEWCGGEAGEPVIAGAVPAWRRSIPFSADRVKRLAGLEIPAYEIVRILASLGFTVNGGEPMEVIPPSWRSDIAGPADLVEEVRADLRARPCAGTGDDAASSRRGSGPDVRAKTTTPGPPHACVTRFSRNDFLLVYCARPVGCVRWR